MSEPIPAVVVIDDTPHYELNATELVFRVATAKENTPFYFHLRPYRADEMKAALRDTKTRIKDAGPKIISEEADPTPLLRLFDALFLRMSNVRMGDGEPSLDQQRAWLDRTPRLKMRLMTEALCTAFVRRSPGAEPTAGLVVDGRRLEEPVALDALLDLDEGARVEFLYLIQSPDDPSRTVAIAMRHEFELETVRDHSIYDHATRREIEKLSGVTTMDVDYDALERLYDRTIRSVAGFASAGKPCTAADREVWVPKIPFYLKKLALDARFEDVTKKNG